MNDGLATAGQQLHRPWAATSARGLPMGWGVFFACWAAAAAVALALGRDSSWDLRHYHYYNAYALLEADGRSTSRPRRRTPSCTPASTCLSTC